MKKTLNELHGKAMDILRSKEDNIMKYSIEELRYLGESELIEEIIILNKEIELLRDWQLKQGKKLEELEEENQDLKYEINDMQDNLYESEA